jgi:uncharacterized membrane protein YfcA
MDLATLIPAIAVALAAGAVRGITGFGGALVMSPALALLLGPRVAVPVVLLLESIVAAPMLVQTRTHVRWRIMGAVIIGACALVPVGVLVLGALEPVVIRRAIAITVIVFALMLLRGWRYTGRQRTTTSLALGAVSGGMLGATSIGGPPVVLYLLSGPDAIETMRANLTLYVTVPALVGILVLWLQGIYDAAAWRTSLWLAPAYSIGLVGGVRVFPHVSETRFRQLTLLPIVVSAGILLA